MTSSNRVRQPSPWFDTAEAADYLGTKAGTLKNWRHRGEGPKYHIINRRLVRYHSADLDAFCLHATSPMAQCPKSP